MASSYKTPGVYVEEISTLPASVAQVETAVPAFIGYTEKAEKKGKPLNLKPTKVTSLKEFEEWFGGAPEPLAIEVDLDSNSAVNSVTITPKFHLYNSLRMFFDNGGGKCYIVSVNTYKTGTSENSISDTEITTGLDTLRKYDEPTLILYPDAVSLDKDKLGTLQQKTLKQCNDLQDRFGVFDVKNGDMDVNDTDDDDESPIDAFRNNIGVKYLKYGAAYYPYIRTTLALDFTYANIKDSITKNDVSTTLSALSSDSTDVDALDTLLGDVETIEGFTDEAVSGLSQFTSPFDGAGYDGTIYEAYGQIDTEQSGNLNTKQELKYRAQYIRELIEGFVGLGDSLVETDDADNYEDDTVTELHAAAIAAESKLEEYAQTLYAYDKGYTTDGGDTTVPLCVIATTAEVLAAVEAASERVGAVLTILDDDLTGSGPDADADDATIDAAIDDAQADIAADAANLADAVSTTEIADGTPSDGNIATAETAIDLAKTDIEALVELVDAIEEAYNTAVEAATVDADEAFEESLAEAQAAAASAAEYITAAADCIDVVGFEAFSLDDVAADTGIYGDTPESSPVATVVARARDDFQALYDGVASVIEDFEAAVDARATALEDLMRDNNPVYSAIVDAVEDEGIVLPPSGAVVGQYAAVDRDRGVWKAPANVSLTGVSEPVVALTSLEQDDLNVDTTAGKSINAIRAFTGKGTLIWGARTLAGNDNEWRYVPVRRFYNMVEESVKKATESMVFEPNDANTWVRVRSMIENYLTRLWRAGALAGAKADQAYFVKVGLGETMTNSDILEGRMIVEIGMAVVRPAEFIILKFSHKMQEA